MALTDLCERDFEAEAKWMLSHWLLTYVSLARPPATHREVAPGVVLILPRKSGIFAPFFGVKVVPEGDRPSDLVLLMPAKGRPRSDFCIIVEAGQHHLEHILEPS